MILEVIKLPLLILYILCCSFMSQSKDNVQRKSFLLCALLCGGMLSL